VPSYFKRPGGFRGSARFNRGVWPAGEAESARRKRRREARANRNPAVEALFGRAHTLIDGVETRADRAKGFVISAVEPGEDLPDGVQLVEDRGLAVGDGGDEGRHHRDVVLEEPLAVENKAELLGEVVEDDLRFCR